MSRIGKKPVELPGGVTATVSGQTIEVKGPKGVRSFSASDDVDLTLEDNTVTVTPRGKSKRASLLNMLMKIAVPAVIAGCAGRSVVGNSSTSRSPTT